GIWAPKGLPTPIIEKMEQGFRSVYGQPEIQAFYERAGSMLAPTASSEEFTAFIEAETTKYKKIVADNQIKVDQ
nr:tripartite tricarboxylate transporter substrate binding protein [Pseudomonas sp.]